MANGTCVLDHYHPHGKIEQIFFLTLERACEGGRGSEEGGGREREREREFQAGSTLTWDSISVP